jgi:hypothetical protein
MAVTELSNPRQNLFGSGARVKDTCKDSDHVLTRDIVVDGGMHTRSCIQRDGGTDMDRAGKMEGCMPEYASRGIDILIRDSGRRDACWSTRPESRTYQTADGGMHARGRII